MLASVVWGSSALQLDIELCHYRRNQSCQSDSIDVVVRMADSETTEIWFAWFENVQRSRSRPAGTTSCARRRLGDCQVDELRKRPRSDLSHGTGTVGLDGPLANIQDISNLLVRIALDNQSNNLPLA
jgi:hypothetical protein